MALSTQRGNGQNVTMNPQRARLFLWLATTAFVLVLAYLTLSSLMPFAVGAIISYALAPLVDRLLILIPLRKPNHESWRRGIAVLLIYLVFFGGIFGIGFALVPVAVEQIVHFVQELPTLVESAREQTMGFVAEYQRRTPPEVQERLNAMAEQAASSFVAIAGYAVQGTVSRLTSTIGLVLGLTVVPFWMFYLMRDRHSVGRNIVRAAPAEVRDDVSMILALSDRMLSRYIRSQLVLGLVVGTAVGISLAVMGIELSLGLAVWAGGTEMIPMIGPWLGAIPGLLIVAATNPEMLPWVALVYFMVQQLENNFLVPRIQGEALDMHPAAVILVLVIGGAAWGFIGLVVAVPGAAIAREWFWYIDRRLRGQTPEEAFAGSHLATAGKQQDASSETPSAASEPIEAAR